MRIAGCSERKTRLRRDRKRWTPLLPYAERLTAEGIRLHALARHLHGLFQGCPGARAFRRHLAENAHLPGAGPEVLAEAASLAAPPDRLAA